MGNVSTSIFPYLLVFTLNILIELENINQLTFNCSKLTIETLEKDVKYVQS